MAQQQKQQRKHPIPLNRYFWGVVLHILIWLFVKVKVQRVENVPPRGAGIVYYNHIHWLDPALISAKLRRYNVPLAKVEARSWPFVGLLLRGYHVIFITRGAVDRQALNATWDILGDGDISVISPEGTRSPDGTLKAAKEGLAFVARRAPDAWWIPCAVTGSTQFKPSWPLLRRTPVNLLYGKPFRIRWPGPRPEDTSREAMREITEEAMAQLAVLLPAEMRGDYAQADPARQKWIEYMDGDHNLA